MVIKKLRDFGFNTDNRTYIIAEIGINHRGDINIAKRLIDSAVRSGVDAQRSRQRCCERPFPTSVKLIGKYFYSLNSKTGC